MSLCDTDRFIYIKEPASGTLQFSIDSKSCVRFTFCERVQIEVFLNAIHTSQFSQHKIEKNCLDNADHKSNWNSPSVELDDGCSSQGDQTLNSELTLETTLDSGNENPQSHIPSSNASVKAKQTNKKKKGQIPTDANKKVVSIPHKKSKPNVSTKTEKKENKRNVKKIVKLKNKTPVRHTSAINSCSTNVKLVGNTGNIVVKKLQAKKSSKWQATCEISCPYCLSVFQTQQAFYDHKKTVRSSSFQCKSCPKVFPFQAFLQAHTKTSHSQSGDSTMKESDLRKCDLCGVETKTMFALKKHLMFHTEEYFYQCCICGKQFVEPGTLNNHMTTHRSGGMIRCKCCNQLFATRGSLARHKLALMEVKCHLCGETFPNRTSRTQHYKLFHQSDILKCVQCTCMFSSHEELTSHMKKHTMYKKKQCTICGKFFSRLEKHIITHKSKSEIDESLLFVCDKCPRKFSNRSSFQRHLSIHSSDKPYQCPNCPRTFADCGVLRKHLRRHSSLMPYQCEVCGKKCKEPGNLKVHMRIHSETKHFPCSFCPQAFNYKISLEGHMRNRHSATKSCSDSVAGLLPDSPHVYDSPEPQAFTSGQSFNVSMVHDMNDRLISEVQHAHDVANRFDSMAHHYRKQQEIMDKHFYDDTGNSAAIYEEKKESYGLLSTHVFDDPSLQRLEVDEDHTKHTYSGDVLSSAYVHPTISECQGDLSLSVTSLNVTPSNGSSLNSSIF